VQCGDDMCKPILSALLVLAPLTLGLVACAPPDEHDSGVGAGGGAGGGTGGAIGSGGGTGTGGLGEAGGAESAITTTRTALLSNNTSASTAFMDVYTPAARFHGSTTPVSNADAPTSTIPLAGMERGAVSKVPVQSLLYPGATTKVFVETQGWFCTNGKDPIPTTDPADQCGGHIDIGYDSNATAHVQAAVADMVSRGFNGAILDWNGPDGQDDGMGAVNQHTTDVVDISAGNATLMMQTAETTGGKLQFALQEDEGMQKCASTPGCDVTSKVASDLDFMAAHYYTSSAYQTLGGRPVAYFFGVDHAAEAHGKTVDWTTIRAQAQKNPLFIFETGDGFTHAETDGAYAWLQPTDLSKYPGSDPFGTTTYLPDFYKQAEAHPTLHAFGSIYKGFDDLDVNGWGGSGGRVSNTSGGLFVGARGGGGGGPPPLHRAAVRQDLARHVRRGRQILLEHAPARGPRGPHLGRLRGGFRDRDRHRELRGGHRVRERLHAALVHRAHDDHDRAGRLQDRPRRRLLARRDDPPLRRLLLSQERRREPHAGRGRSAGLDEERRPDRQDPRGRARALHPGGQPAVDQEPPLGRGPLGMRRSPGAGSARRRPVGTTGRCRRVLLVP
jgi:hypothetical protein